MKKKFHRNEKKSFIVMEKKFHDDETCETFSTNKD